MAGLGLRFQGAKQSNIQVNFALFGSRSVSLQASLPFSLSLTSPFLPLPPYTKKENTPSYYSQKHDERSDRMLHGTCNVLKMDAALMMEAVTHTSP